MGKTVYSSFVQAIDAGRCERGCHHSNLGLGERPVNDFGQRSNWTREILPSVIVGSNYSTGLMGHGVDSLDRNAYLRLELWVFN